MLDYASPVGKQPDSPQNGTPLFTDHGQLDTLGAGVHFLTDPVNFLLKTGKGSRTVQRFRTATGGTLFLVHRPDHVEQVLQRNVSHYRKASPYSLVKLLFGKGLLFNEGAEHLSQKRLMHPSFSPKAVNLLTPSILSTIKNGLVEWEPKAKQGTKVNLEVFTQDLARRIIEQSMFGFDHSISIENLLHQDPSKMRMLIGALPLSPQRPRIFRVRRYLETNILAAKERRLEYMAAHPDEPAPDILAALCSAQHKDTGETMPDKQLVDEIITLLFSGFDTSARTLTGCFHALSENPEIHEKFMAEVEGVTEDQMLAMGPGALPYVVRVIRETMRLYPPNPLIGRMALQDTEIGSCPVPKGAFVALAPFLSHRDPEEWPNPDKFDPDRFLPENEKGRPKYAYFPFGGGLRQCIGLGLAMTAIPLTASLLARKYSIHRLHEGPVAFDIRLTLRTKGPYWIKLQERDVH